MSALVTQTVSALGDSGRAELDLFLDIQSRWSTMIDDVEALRIEKRP